MGDNAVAGMLYDHMFEPYIKTDCLSDRLRSDFYLHHCQVDRILALWSALNPGVWVTKSFEEDGTFTIPDGATVDKNTRTSLTPMATLSLADICICSSYSLLERADHLLDLR